MWGNSENMDNPLDIITLTFTRKQWFEVLDAARSSEYGSVPEEFEVMVVAALCADGHVEDITTLKTEVYWGRHYPKSQAKEVICTCRNCGTYLWQIRPYQSFQEEGFYDYYEYAPNKGLANHIRFFPGDENDPRKVELDERTNTKANKDTDNRGNDFGNRSVHS